MRGHRELGAILGLKDRLRQTRILYFDKDFIGEVLALRAVLVADLDWIKPVDNLVQFLVDELVVALDLMMNQHIRAITSTALPKV